MSEKEFYVKSISSSLCSFEFGGCGPEGDVFLTQPAIAGARAELKGMGKSSEVVPQGEVGYSTGSLSSPPHTHREITAITIISSWYMSSFGM